MDLTFSSFLKVLTPIDRKIIYILNEAQKRYTSVFYSVGKIATICRCSTRSVERFFVKNENLGNAFIEKKTRFNGRGQTTNTYSISNSFKEPLSFLSEHGYILSKKSKNAQIISHYENRLKCRPPPEPVSQTTEKAKCHPSYKDTLIKNTSKKKPSALPKEVGEKKDFDRSNFQPHLRGTNFSLKNTCKLEIYPPSCFFGAKEIMENKYSKGIRFTNPDEFFQQTVENLGKKQGIVYEHPIFLNIARRYV